MNLPNPLDVNWVNLKILSVTCVSMMGGKTLKFTEFNDSHLGKLT